MRPSNTVALLNHPAYQNGASSPISADQVFAGSAQLVNSGTGVGTLQFQASNDTVFAPNVPTNWSLIGSSVAISGANVYLSPKQDICYQWLRVLYTYTGTGIQHVTASDDVAGSLNSKYFLLDSSISANKYYVWLDNGAGVDPAIAGRTGIQVSYSDDDVAQTIGTAIASAVQAVNTGADFTASSTLGVITITMVVAGPFVPAADGNTGFVFAVISAAGLISANVKTLGM